jgi:hypothetical protein
MSAAHKFLDPEQLKNLSGAELLLLRLRYGASVTSAVERELNRRAGVAYSTLEYVPIAADAPSRGRRRIRRFKAA